MILIEIIGNVHDSFFWIDGTLQLELILPFRIFSQFNVLGGPAETQNS